ncbi:MAG: TonB C-terminal domain-containing protein [SAR86 cluster bacterium]|uniref:TonB C-terminal domain-containing protein n=1 Tax=SAR86 cluster bacterium TaxID=2030880 RepID=A0A520MCB7_9GAMM|nr:MAG: TonB C-terminal domain-containing protein [SAR86 cluster bacterium]|tara:strand:- start:2041 stop:2667 length:627 start_codon:yes stop_codon:yes gene_type:complete
MQTKQHYIQASFLSFLIHASIFLYLIGFFYSEKQVRPILSKAVNVNIIVDEGPKEDPIIKKPSKVFKAEEVIISTKSENINEVPKINETGSITNLQSLLSEELEAFNSSALEEEINKYSNYMISLIEAAWIKPKNIQDNLICDIKIKTNQAGRIIDINLTKSSGNIRFDNSALQAVKRVETFSFFADIRKETYEDVFQNIVISFNPSK